MNAAAVLAELRRLANPEKVVYKEKKYGIKAENALGVYHADLNQLAKKIGKDDALAMELFNSEVYEARLLCSKIFKPQSLTDELMEQWVSTFDNWEITDSFCMALFSKSKLALPKITAWTQRDAEFEKRAGFVTMAAYGSADKKADNAVFENFFPLILTAIEDGRIYVRKAVNWTLRNIGKRNSDLRTKAIALAKQILKNDHPAAQWIAKDALRELEKTDLKLRNYPIAIYRK